MDWDALVSSHFVRSLMVGVLLKLVRLVLTQMSPALREALKAFVADWEAKSRQTSNPWDDVLVDFIKAVLGL